jgi:hypothetical protein
VTTFGGPGGWGEEPHEEPQEDIEPEASESFPQELDLGGGFKMFIKPDMFRTIMHTPEITAATAERCEAICAAANALAILDGAEYVFVVSNNPDNIRARGRVKTGNAKAIVDNAINATLLKALAQVGSDPKPEPAQVDSLLPDAESFSSETSEEAPIVDLDAEDGEEGQ